MAKKKPRAMSERYAAALRTEWRKYSPERKTALARQKIKGIAKGFLCQFCNKLTTSAEVDHMIPVGVRPCSRNDNGSQTWDGFIYRLEAPAGQLQVLCKPCHKLKTDNDRRNGFK